MSRHTLRLAPLPKEPVPIKQTPTERDYSRTERLHPESIDLLAALEKSHEKALWELNIGELAGHNIESRGREEVNRLLDEGWVLLHIYTLRYEEDGIWRERPMAILGRPRN